MTPATLPKVYCWTQQIATVRPAMIRSGILAPIVSIVDRRPLDYFVPDSLRGDLIFFALAGIKLPDDISCALNSRRARIFWIENP